MKYTLTGTTKTFTLVIGEQYGTPITRTVTLSQIMYQENFRTWDDMEVYSSQLGGWIESESNLSQNGLCYISPNVWLIGDTIVSGNAKVEMGIYYDCNINGNTRVNINNEILNWSTISISNNISINKLTRNCEFGDNAYVVIGSGTITETGGDFSNMNISNIDVHDNVFIECILNNYVVITSSHFYDYTKLFVQETHSASETLNTMSLHIDHTVIKNNSKIIFANPSGLASSLMIYDSYIGGKNIINICPGNITIQNCELFDNSIIDNSHKDSLSGRSIQLYKSRITGGTVIY